MRFCFADLQTHWLALVIVEYLLCVSYIFHKWNIMWHGAPLCLNAYEYCYVTDLGHISPPGLLAPFVIFVPRSIRCVIHTNYTCYFVNHCFVCLGVLHGAGEPGSKCISFGFSSLLLWPIDLVSFQAQHKVPATSFITTTCTVSYATVWLFSFCGVGAGETWSRCVYV